MLDIAAQKHCTLCTGGSGTGKTTFALRYLVADKKLNWRAIFDPEGEYQQRLKLPAVDSKDSADWQASAESGFIIFDPHACFPGQMEAAFDWFCEAVFYLATNSPGRKLMLTDEAWKYQTANKVSQPLRNCIQTGRRRGLEMFFASQQPNRLNEVITNETTELVCFRLQGINALQRVESLGANPSEVSNLKPGQYISLNTVSGRALQGNLW